MLHLDVDITGFIPTVGYDPAEIQHRILSLAEMGRSEWIRLAQTRLRSSSPEYIAGIQPVVFKEGQFARVSLVGWLPNSIEHGLAPFDMKPGLLAGPHAKPTQSGGRINIVPFRHTNPGATQRTVGQPMPTDSTTPAGRPRSIVYSAAKRLKASTDKPGGGTSWGGRTDDFGGLGIRTQLDQPGGRPGAYTWKSSPYANMYKIQKFYRNVAQNQYLTFRAVSSNSDPNSWWHPGIKPSRLAPIVQAYINEMVRRIFS